MFLSINNLLKWNLCYRKVWTKWIWFLSFLGDFAWFCFISPGILTSLAEIFLSTQNLESSVKSHFDASLISNGSKKYLTTLHLQVEISVIDWDTDQWCKSPVRDLWWLSCFTHFPPLLASRHQSWCRWPLGKLEMTWMHSGGCCSFHFTAADWATAAHVTRRHVRLTVSPVFGAGAICLVVEPKSTGAEVWMNFHDVGQQVPTPAPLCCPQASTRWLFFPNNLQTFHPDEEKIVEPLVS